MNNPLSLVQELRNIKRGSTSNQADTEDPLSELQEIRQQCKADVAEAQRILQELRGAISELSAVDPKGEAPGANGTSRSGFNALESQVQNEIETFRSSIIAELSEWLRGQSQIILEPVQKEMSGRLDNLVEEFHTRLQARLESEQGEVPAQTRQCIKEFIQSKVDGFEERVRLMSEGAAFSVPVTVQKSLEPHIQELTARFKASFQQDLQLVRDDQESNFQNKLQEFQAAIQAQMGNIEQEVRRIYEQSAGPAEKALSDHVEAVMDKAKQRLETDAESARELQDARAKEALSNIQKVSQDTLDSSLQRVQQHLDEVLEHSKGELKSSTQILMEEMLHHMADLEQVSRGSLSGEAERLAGGLRNVAEELKAIEQQRIAELGSSLAALGQTTLDGHAQNIKQVAEAQLEDIRKTLHEFQAQAASEHEARLRESMEAQDKAVLEQMRRQTDEATSKAIEEIKASSEQVLHELAGKAGQEVNTVTTVLNQWVQQTTVWAQSFVKDSLDAYKSQVAQFTETVLQEQHGAVQLLVGGVRSRLEEAARLLSPEYDIEHQRFAESMQSSSSSTPEFTSAMNATENS